MANRKITELTSLTTPAGDDVLAIVDISETSNATKNKKITVANLIENFADVDLKLANGTESAPSLAFTSATSTGLYRSAANELSIATNGGQAIKVEANNKTTIYGDLVVTGGTTTISSTQIDVTDKNLQLATGNSSDSGADGGGLTLKGASDKTWNWVDSTDAWTANQHIDVTTGKVFKIAGTQVLSATTLGAGIVNSSLTSVGTLGSLTVTNAVTAGSLDISGGADIDGTLEADAYTVNGTALNEYIADTVGAMVSSNTESDIVVTYQDSDNTLDFTVSNISGTSGGLSGTPNITVGVVTGGSLDISGDADIDGTLEADAITIDGTALNEFIADTVGAMVSSNTETNIAVTYDDSDNTLDFSVVNITGNAATATALQTARTINGVSFDGTGNITVTSAAGTLSGTTLNSSVVTSSLTSVGTLGSLNVTNTVTANLFSGSGASLTALNADNISSGTLTSARIEDNAITRNKISDGEVISSKLDSSAVTTSKINNGAITNDKISNSAAIAGTKISPDFGSQAITTTGVINGKDLVLTDTHPSITYTDSDGNPDYQLKVNHGWFRIHDATNDEERLTVNSNGHIDIHGNLDCLAGVDVTGNITVTGTVDGVDIATRDTLFGGLTSSSGVLTNGVTATTQSASDNSTKVATTAYTDTAISNLVDSSPGALNTLNELAAALGDDANFSTTVTNSIATKAPKSNPIFTGNDFGFGATPGGTPASKNIFLAIGDSDTGIVQDGDGQLEFWGNAVEIANLNAIDGYTSVKPITTTGTITGNLFSGSGASLTNVNATTLDSIDSGSFLRSDANDTMSGELTLTSANSYPIDINGSNDAKIALRGSSNPYIRWRESNTDKAYIQWNSTDGYLHIHNQEDNSHLKLWDSFTFSPDGSNHHTIWHSGNDGSGSGLDADTLDGMGAPSFLRSAASDSFSGDTLTFDGSGNEKIILQGSGNAPYIRFREGTTEKAYIQWHFNGYFQLRNQEDSSGLRIYDSFTFTNDSSNWHSIWHSGNDGSGSGLDADLLDGQEGSYYRNASNLNAGTVPTARLGSGTASSSVFLRGDGTWTGVSAGDATQLDGLDSTQFLRSDANDTMSGQLTLTYGGEYPLVINNNYDGKIVLQGSNSPYIRFKESTSDKAFIQWSNAGYLNLYNQEDNSSIILRDAIGFSTDGSTYHAVWHAGNDGSGSSLDADTLDGTQGSGFLRSDTSDAFTSGTLSIHDMQFQAGNVAQNLKLKGNNGTDIGLSLYNSQNTWVGQLYGTSGGHYGFLNSNWGSWDLKKAPNGQLEVRIGSTNQTVWHTGNDGSGSGLDADTLDGVQGASYLRSDANDSASGQLALTFSGEYPLAISNNYDGKIELSGSNNPYIRFEEGSTDKAYIQWNSGGFLSLFNQEDNSAIIVRDAIGFTTDGSNYNAVWHSGNDGSGSGLDADLLDGVQGSNYLRSNTADSMGAKLTLNQDNDDEKLVLAGTNDPYIRFQEGTTDKAYIQWNAGGWFQFHNAEDGSGIRVKDDIIFSNNNFSSSERLWNGYNDGTGSGLDADLWDGQQFSAYLNQAVTTGANPTFNDIYSNSWIRNNDSTEGLYNQSTNQHWYSDAVNMYNLDGNGTDVGIRFRDNHNSTIRGYVYANNSSQVGFLNANGDWAFCVNGSTNLISYFDFIPSSNNSKDLGSSSNRWKVIYTNDLSMSNKGGANSVDGTWGDWTIQEGEDSLFLLNNRKNKRYKFNLTEVS